MMGCCDQNDCLKHSILSSIEGRRSINNAELLSTNNRRVVNSLNLTVYWVWILNIMNIEFILIRVSTGLDDIGI